MDEKGNLQGIRILGVLARIALCYLFAAIIIYYLKPAQVFFTGLLMLLIYWALCLLFGDAQDPYSMTGWFGNKVDFAVLGVAHMYKGEGIPFDPEGIMSTLPSIVNVIFGFFAGDYIQKKGKNHEMLNGLFVAGVAMVITGLCWNMVFPINKKIWTSSFTITTSGLATITIATMIYLIEFKNARGWLSRFFEVFGKNALFVFALSAFLPKGLSLIKFKDGSNPWSWLYQNGFRHLPGDPRLGSLFYALTVITFMWAICYWLDKKKIYIKV